ncbi:hypothetical protein [Labrenzia sp. PHM005]|uniref:hypothetical protein n=1 Tax=Labrenzia sp. PHM005 TaxID=2590016 RepID=UPI0011407235|nr:hypothetical protein [Labrenzia sp. PHM005]QDG76966.1 hypothetical protein FJ695_14370 [Labrenzia sp. PHM005]
MSYQPTTPLPLAINTAPVMPLEFYVPPGPPGDQGVNRNTSPFLTDLDEFSWTAPEGLEVSTNPVEFNDLPFLNLDPYNLEGKDNLPTGDLTKGPHGSISAQVDVQNGHGEQQVNFGLEMENYTYRTEYGQIDILTLAEERTTEVKTINFNGQEVAVEYQSGIAQEFGGSFYDQQFRELYVEMAFETGMAIQAEAFDASGNPIMTAFGYEQMLEVYGEAIDYGIQSFEMIFELGIDLQLNDFGMYEMTLSVVFEGEIAYMNGAERIYEFADELFFMFSDQEQIDFNQIPAGLYNEIDRFAAGMGDAWGGMEILNAQLEAIFLQLKEDGHYQSWDDVDQGLDNPFDFNVPPSDWLT